MSAATAAARLVRESPPSATEPAVRPLHCSPVIPIPVYRIQLERTDSVLWDAGTCATSDDVVRIVRKYLGEPDREYFLAVYVDPHLVVIGLHTVSIGGRWSVSLTAGEVFKAGMLCNATGVVLVHNHPAGRAKASKDDHILTTELELAGLLVGIQVVDHVILGMDDSLSMREQDKMVVPLVGEFDVDAYLSDTARAVNRRKRVRKAGAK